MWINLATQYYVAGRFASTAGLVPVYGNLFHHAIELYLKAILASTLSKKQLKQRWHHLDQLWEEVKSQHATMNLSRFDGTIRALHRFEDVRYPNEAGMIASLMPPGSQQGVTLMVGPLPSTLPHAHEVHVAEIDELVVELVRLLVPPGYVPSALLSLTDEGLRALKHENQMASRWFDTALSGSA